MKTIERGMDESNQNDIWCGLQVFYNLGELRSAVDTIVSKYKGIGVKSVGAALDMKAISTSSAGFGPGGVQRSGTPQIGGGKRATDALWERMGKCMDELHKVVTAVWHLQAVLSKKRVPFTQVLFLNEVWQVSNLFNISGSFYETLSKELVFDLLHFFFFALLKPCSYHR